MPPKKPPLESQVVRDFRALVSALFPGSFSYKNHQTAFSGAGFPDLTVVIRGTVLFLEGKRGNEDLSTQQEATLRELTAAGAIAGTLRGGSKKGVFHLAPWLSEEELEDTYTLRADGSMSRTDLITILKEFVNACSVGVRSSPCVDGW